MRLGCFILFKVLLVLGSRAMAQTNDSIPEHSTFTLSSARVSELRTINVWTPPGYSTSKDSLPVLYMLDGGIKEDFPHLANTVAMLVQSNKIPPIILVGIENTQRPNGPNTSEKG